MLGLSLAFPLLSCNLNRAGTMLAIVVRSVSLIYDGRFEVRGGLFVEATHFSVRTV